jgi:hypothetical protein
MARYPYGINGPFYGKAGSVIGSRWKEIDYIKGLSRRSNKPPTAAQLTQRGRFSYIQEWLKPFRPFINLGLMHYSGKMTALNAAHSLNSDKVSGTAGDFIADQKEIVLSYGDLPPVENMDTVTGPGMVHLTWTGNSGYAGHMDQLMLVIYVPELVFADFVFGRACRGDGKVSFEVPPVVAGHQAFGYLAFSSLDRKRVSTSQYLGVFTLQ